MNTAYQTESEFYTREDGIMELSCRVELAIGYRVTIDGNTGKVGYQPFVGGYVSPLSFPTVTEAQQDIARLVSVQVRQLELAIPGEGATSDMEYHLSVLRSLAGIAQGDEVQEKVGTDVVVVDDESPFVTDEEGEGITFEIERDSVKALATDYLNFSLREYLNRLEHWAMHLDEYDYERFSCLCQLKGDVFAEVEENICHELRLYHQDDVISKHMRLVMNGGYAALPSFTTQVKRALGMMMNVYYWGTTDPAHLLDE